MTVIDASIRPLDKYEDARQSWAMPYSQLPGPQTIAALMLSAVIVSAVAIKGPIPIPYEVVKDFQPLIAAAVALCAAALAYSGAKAKVNFDRSIHEANELRRKGNLVRKLRYAAMIAFGEAKTMREQTVPPSGVWPAK
jgi:hypothetical protein